MTLWMIWTWKWLLGAYFWMPLFEQQFILHKTVRWIYDTWRIIFGTVWDSYPRNWKTVQLTKRNHWCKHKRPQRCHVDVDKLIMRKGSSDHQRQNLRLLRLCAVGKMGDDLIATWKSKIKWYSENNYFKDMNRLDGMPTEFEWKIFPGITALGLLEKIQNLMRDLQCEPEHFKDRIIFMSMCNGVAWQAKGNQEQCEYNSQTVANCARKFPLRSLVFLGAWTRRKVVRNLRWQTRWIMGSNGRRNDGKFLWIRSSNIPCLQCLWERRITKHRRRQEVNSTLQWWSWKHRVASPCSAFCESAQYLRTNSTFMRQSTPRY